MPERLMRSWFVMSEPYEVHPASELDPPETGRDVEFVRAPTAREAKAEGVRRMLRYRRGWCRDRVSDRLSPYGGVTVEAAACHHGVDLCSDPPCPACEYEIAAQERAEGAGCLTAK